MELHQQVKQVSDRLKKAEQVLDQIEKALPYQHFNENVATAITRYKAEMETEG